MEKTDEKPNYSVEHIEEKELRGMELCDYLDVKVMNMMSSLEEFISILNKGLNDLPFTQKKINELYKEFQLNYKKSRMEFEEVEELLIDVEKLKIDYKEYIVDPGKKYYF